MEEETSAEVIEQVFFTGVTGEAYWAYVQIPIELYPHFKEALHSDGPVYLQEFGKIICCGEGSEPDHRTVRRIREAYSIPSKAVERMVKDAEQEILCSEEE